MSIRVGKISLKIILPLWVIFILWGCQSEIADPGPYCPKEDDLVNLESYNSRKEAESVNVYLKDSGLHPEFGFSNLYTLYVPKKYEWKVIRLIDVGEFDDTYISRYNIQKYEIDHGFWEKIITFGAITDKYLFVMWKLMDSGVPAVLLSNKYFYICVPYKELNQAKKLLYDHQIKANISKIKKPK